MTQFGEARKIMGDTLTRDAELFLIYQANIAAILLDHGRITDHERREKTADRILRLVFDFHPASNQHTSHTLIVDPQEAKETI